MQLLRSVVGLNPVAPARSFELDAGPDRVLAPAPPDNPGAPRDSQPVPVQSREAWDLGI